MATNDYDLAAHVAHLHDQVEHYRDQCIRLKAHIEELERIISIWADNAAGWEQLHDNAQRRGDDLYGALQRSWALYEGRP